jgi:hypothetical protein
MLSPVYLFLRGQNPIRAVLSVRRPDVSTDIQCAVNAKYDARLALDHTLAVKLMRPEECYGTKLTLEEKA